MGIEESELPQFLVQSSEDIELAELQAEEEENAIVMGRGNRARKEVAYQEQLSERDWLKAIGAEEEGEEDGDGDIPEYQEESPKKKKSKKRREDDVEQEEEPRKKKCSKRMMKKMRKLLEVVMQYEDSDGRILSEPFYKLPSRKELPDYYEVIRKPVDILKIQQRIEDDKYEDMDTLERDFMVLCKNTQQYNEDGSLIFEDSIVLQSVFTNARERLEQEPDEPEEEESAPHIEGMDEDDSNSRMSAGSSGSVRKKKKDGSKSAKKKKSKYVDSDDEEDD